MATNGGDKIDPRRIPGGTQRDILFSHLPNNPDELLHESLYPTDAYEGQTY